MGRLFWTFFCSALAGQLLTFAAGTEAYHLMHRPGGPTPYLAFLGAAFGGGASAALLAWYFAKPIRNLRSALTAAAEGCLDVHFDPGMLRGRNELADLGRHFNRMADRLRALIEGQQRLLHDVSHEMRSPLARLQTAVGLVRRQPEKLDAHLKRIELEATRMDTLVEELLTLAQAQSGVGFEMDEEIGLVDLAAAVVEDCDFEARLTGGKVQLQATSSPSVRGNSELLHRAIENVVRNAVKHGAPGHTVTVELGGSDEVGRAWVRVLDSGPGVPPEYLETIFEPFRRPPNVSRTAAESHGLGLAIAQRIVEAHGGRISASNRREGGLSVEILLGVSSADEACVRAGADVLGRP